MEGIRVYKNFSNIRMKLDLDSVLALEEQPGIIQLEDLERMWKPETSL